jgi:hypothetical protein
MPSNKLWIKRELKKTLLDPKLTPGRKMYGLLRLAQMEGLLEGGALHRVRIHDTNRSEQGGTRSIPPMSNDLQDLFNQLQQEAESEEDTTQDQSTNPQDPGLGVGS